MSFLTHDWEVSASGRYLQTWKIIVWITPSAEMNLRHSQVTDVLAALHTFNWRVFCFHRTSSLTPNFFSLIDLVDHIWWGLTDLNGSRLLHLLSSCFGILKVGVLRCPDQRRCLFPGLDLVLALITAFKLLFNLWRDLGEEISGNSVDFLLEFDQVAILVP